MKIFFSIINSIISKLPEILSSACIHNNIYIVLGLFDGHSVVSWSLGLVVRPQAIYVIFFSHFNVFIFISIKDTDKFCIPWRGKCIYVQDKMKIDNGLWQLFLFQYFYWWRYILLYLIYLRADIEYKQYFFLTGVDWTESFRSFTVDLCWSLHICWKILSATWK